MYDLYLESLTDYDKVKSDVDKKNFLTFLGSSDRDKLKEDKKAHGNLLIYHEIMTFILANQKDAMLLTNDTTEND